MGLKKSGLASGAAGSLKGAAGYGGLATGLAAASLPVAPWLAPLMIGGGALAGYLGDQADQEALENDPEYQAQKRKNNSMKLFSANMGRAFRAARPTTMKGVMNA